jgi:hypothetical protein
VIISPTERGIPPSGTLTMPSAKPFANERIAFEHRLAAALRMRPS